jgi:hypothetical protein
MLDSQAPARARPRQPPAAERARSWRHELPALALCTLAVYLITSLPYLYASLASPPGRHFQGIVFNLADHVQYFSWLRDHRSSWLVPNRMTPEANAPALFNLLWLAVGRLQRATGWGVPALFQGVRLLAIVGLTGALAATCRLFTRSRGERWTAYGLIVLGSGLGWIWVLEKYVRGLSDVRFPLDLYVGEPNTMFAIMAFPHFAIACALILGSFWCLLRGIELRSWRLVAASAALGLALTLQHAYDLLIIGLVPGAFLGLVALRDRRIPWFGVGALLAVGLVAAPPALYFTLLTSRDPLWRAVLAQFANAGVYTPPPAHLLVLMGLPLLLALAGMAWGLWGLARTRAWAQLIPVDNRDLFLWSWMLVGFLLLYVPTDFQIHMLNSWQVPVGLLAARTLYRQIMPALQAPWPRLARVAPLIALLAVLPTNLYLTAWRIAELSRFQAPYTLSSGQQAALDWLGENADSTTVVLSGLELGQFVPVYSDGRAFLGHWAQTVAFFDKRELVRSFFDGRSPEAGRRATIEQYGVTHVLHGPEERAIGDYDPAESPLLEPAYSSGDVSVYRVRP